MFGFRPDGKSVGKRVDPIIRLTPYIMRKRDDSQVFYKLHLPSEPIDEYTKKMRQNGICISAMTVIIAAYIRASYEMPVLNRFIVNKVIYDRNELTVTFVVLKSNARKESKETTVKVKFTNDETMFSIAKKLNEAIESNRSMEDSNSTDAFCNFLLSVPGLANFGVLFIMLLDRYGLLPRPIIDLSPFHTSLFISNMASIGMDEIYHHIYNFGTTSAFLGMGKKERRMKVALDGSTKTEYCYPVGVVIDERVAAGAQYAMFFGIMKKYLRNPELLELPVKEESTESAVIAEGAAAHA